jgi:formylglycine-generating enzyme required for sulfatase activity
VALIPGGDFSTPASAKPEKVPDFCLDRTEVTVAAFHACVKAGKCGPPAAGPGCKFAEPGRADHPVNCVTWNHTVGYCRAQDAFLTPDRPWEWAARGGDRAAPFPQGNNSPNIGFRCMQSPAAPSAR